MSLSPKAKDFLEKINKRIENFNVDMGIANVVNHFVLLNKAIQKEVLEKFVNVYYSGETDDSGADDFIHDNFPVFFCKLDMETVHDDIFIHFCERSNGKYENVLFWKKVIKEVEKRNLNIKKDVIDKKNVSGLIHFSHVTKEDIIKAYKEDLGNHGNIGQCLNLIIKYEHYFEDKDFVKSLLPKTSNLIPFFARKFLQKTEFLNEISGDLRDEKLTIENGQLNRLYSYIEDTLFLNKLIDDSSYTDSHDRAIAIIRKGHPKIKGNKEFVKSLISRTDENLLQVERFKDIIQDVSYELQCDEELLRYFSEEDKKVILWDGNINDLKTREDYLRFTLNFRSNFIFIPRKYKEDLEFVKEAAKSVELWPFLPHQFRHDKELIRESFGCSNSAIKFFGFSNVLEGAEEAKVIENDETFFLILDEYSNHNPVYVIAYKTLIKNETFYNLLKESVVASNYELDLSNITQVVKDMHVKYHEKLMYDAIKESSNKNSGNLKPKIKKF